MLPRRPLGRTGENLSIIGFGGILVRDTSPSEAEALVGSAIDHGVNYFDVAPSYGNAEECLGPALKPYRGQVFLACKTGKRTGDAARHELEASLRRLHTDHLDLYQLHGMTTSEDLAQATRPGGALEAFEKARADGLVRFLGFSAHSVDIALQLLDIFPFDTILFPINWVGMLHGNFGPQVLRKAAEKGVGRLALKAMARQAYAPGAPRQYAKCWYEPCDNRPEAELALRFTLSQDVTAAIPPGDQRFFPWALETAENFTPVTPDEITQLHTKAASLRPIFRHPA